MEKKKGSLSIVFLVIAIILVVVMGALLYMQKIEADRQIAELENNATKLQETINDLQGKIDSVSNIVNDSSNNNIIKIEGEYNIVENDNSEGLTYKFEGNKVTFTALYTTKGTYEIADNKIKITYSEAYDVDGNSIDYPNGKYEELTIVDENTLTSKKIRDGVAYTGKYVKNVALSENSSESNNTVDNKDDKFSDKEIKDSITNYLNIFKGAGSVEGRLEKMGLLEFGEFNNNQTTTDNYRKTDIKYSDFKSTVKNYVSEEWFDTINNNTKWEITEFKEQDGLLYYYDSGWTGTEYEVESITVKGDYSDSRYIAKVYLINIDDSKELENIEFEITNYNGKCVISYCD